MAKYPKITVTAKGLDVLTRAVTSKKVLIFTRAALGDGTYTGNASTLTNLISKKLDCEFVSGQNEGGGVYALRFIASNSTLTQSFRMREIGVYAKADGDTTDILYAYTNGGDETDTVPDKNTPINSIPIDVYVGTSSSATVNVTLSDSKYATTENVEAHRTKTPIDHPDRSVTESKLADNAVTTRTVKDGQITEGKLAFTPAHLVGGKVPAGELPDLSTSEIWRYT